MTDAITDYTNDFKRAEIISLLPKGKNEAFPKLIIQTQTGRIILMEISFCKTLVGVDD